MKPVEPRIYRRLAPGAAAAIKSCLLVIGQRQVSLGQNLQPSINNAAQQQGSVDVRAHHACAGGAPAQGGAQVHTRWPQRLPPWEDYIPFGPFPSGRPCSAAFMAAMATSSMGSEGSLVVRRCSCMPGQRRARAHLLSAWASPFNIS